MSTLLYVKNDGLYADSRHLLSSFETPVSIESTSKIRLSKDETFIYGYTGYLFHQDIEEIENAIRKWLTVIHDKNELVTRTPPHVVIALKNGKKNSIPVFDGKAFIVTRKQVWAINENGEISVKLSAYEYEYRGIGTGGKFAEGMLRITADPMQAMEAAIWKDPVSGGKIQRVGIELLKEAEYY